MNLLEDTIKPHVTRIMALVYIVVALSIFGALAVHFFLVYFGTGTPVLNGEISASYPLKLLGFGLAVMAGLEFIRRLFTPTLEQMVVPIMLGLASALFMLLSGSELGDWEKALMVLALTASMIGLFWAREAFTKSEATSVEALEKTDEPSAISEQEVEPPPLKSAEQNKIY